MRQFNMWTCGQVACGQLDGLQVDMWQLNR